MAEPQLETAMVHVDEADLLRAQGRVAELNKRLDALDTFERDLTTRRQRTTTALTMFNAGVKENVVPQHAEARINFRLLPGDTPDDVVVHVRVVVDDPLVDGLLASDLPTVLIGHRRLDDSASYVDIDDVSASEAIVDHLLDVVERVPRGEGARTSRVGEDVRAARVEVGEVCDLRVLLVLRHAFGAREGLDEFIHRDIRSGDMIEARLPEFFCGLGGGADPDIVSLIPKRFGIGKDRGQVARQGHSRKHNAHEIFSEKTPFSGEDNTCRNHILRLTGWFDHDFA